MGVLKGWSQASRQGRGEPPGTGRGCMHTLPWCGGRAACTRTVPRPSIPTQNTPREVTQWTYSAALLKRLLCSTARVNHSHTQPPPHHSPEINPTCTIPILLPGSRLITPTPPCCHTTHAQSLTLPQVTRPTQTPHSVRFALSQRATNTHSPCSRQLGVQVRQSSQTQAIPRGTSWLLLHLPHKTGRLMCM